MISVRVDAADFDVGRELEALHTGNHQIGALASFVGLVRSNNEGDSVATLHLQHYPGMTEKSIATIVDQAFERWKLYDALVIHRVGPLSPGERIVLVAVTGAHRGETFSACEFIMDYLKTRAPFWKREETDAGARWVDARDTDQQAAQRWDEGTGSRNYSGMD